MRILHVKDVAYFWFDFLFEFLFGIKILFGEIDVK